MTTFTVPSVEERPSLRLSPRVGREWRCTELVRRAAVWPTSVSTGTRATLDLETLWIRDVTITTGLVDTFTTPRLLDRSPAAASTPRRSPRIASVSTSRWWRTTYSATLRRRTRSRSSSARSLSSWRAIRPQCLQGPLARKSVARSSSTGGSWRVTAFRVGRRVNSRIPSQHKPRCPDAADGGPCRRGRG